MLESQYNGKIDEHRYKSLNIILSYIENQSNYKKHCNWNIEKHAFAGKIKEYTWQHCFIYRIKICIYWRNKSITVPCQAIDLYKKNLVEIQQRKDWKTKGTGAQFMGALSQNDEVDLNHIFPTDVALTADHKMIYTACLQEGTSINIKSLTDLQETEGLVLRKNDFVVQDMAYDESKAFSTIRSHTGL